MVKKVWVVYVTVAAGRVGIYGHERLDLAVDKFGETVSPRMAETWARDVVGKTRQLPDATGDGSKRFGLVLSSHAVEEERQEGEQLMIEGTERK